MRRVVLWCLVVIVVPIVLAIFGTLIPNPWVFSDEDRTPTRHILVVSNTLHTDIAIPIDPESLTVFDFLVDTTVPITHPNARWLLIGWGGRSFYLETPSLSDIKPGPTFRALTIDSSVMHVDVLGEIVPGSPDVTDIAITEAAYANLLSEISASFARPNGSVQPIDGFAFGTTDKFFEGVGSFNALLGCNVWTSRMLRSAGMRTGIWNPLPGLLTFSLGVYNGEAVSPG
ncbi:TIGR02117 family protein [Devosia sp. SL43]|nr:TIGR02117 family protein [Devosia sp. SL43]